MQAAMNAEFNTETFFTPETGLAVAEAQRDIVATTAAPGPVSSPSPFAPVSLANDESMNVDTGRGVDQNVAVGDEEPQGMRRKRSREAEDSDANVVGALGCELDEEAEPVSTPVWQVSVINPSSFTQIVKMINDVIPECFMKVVNTPGFKGLGFEAVDNANICYLLARLACETHIDESCSPRQLWSCVNMDWVQTIAECVPMQSQLNIVSLNGSDSLLLSAVEMARNGKHIEAEMHTISKDPPTKRMRDLQHAFVIEFGVADLKEIVCTGRGAKADNLAFTILGYKEAVGVGRRNREQMFMEISFVSPMGRMVFLFAHTDASGPVGPAGTGNRSADPTHDTTSDGGSFSAAERTEVDRHLLEEKFSGEYSIKYLSHILKGMQRRSIIIKLDPSAPLFIEYPMGDNLSFVRWLLARRQPDAGQ